MAIIKNAAFKLETVKVLTFFLQIFQRECFNIIVLCFGYLAFPIAFSVGLSLSDPAFRKNHRNWNENPHHTFTERR